MSTYPVVLSYWRYKEILSFIYHGLKREKCGLVVRLGFQELIAMAWVQPLIRELKFWKPPGTAGKINKTVTSYTGLQFVTIYKETFKGNVFL